MTPNDRMFFVKVIAKQQPISALQGGLCSFWQHAFPWVVFCIGNREYLSLDNLQRTKVWLVALEGGKLKSWRSHPLSIW